jgi:Ca2+-binding EF-hand superfamily protein
MGNQVGKGANRMAIAAMSNVTHVERRELLALQERLKEFAAREGNPNSVNRGEFTEAINYIGLDQNDKEIFDRLFTMYDKTGDDVIIFRDFLAGVSPLISGSAADKIEFAFKMYDLEGKGTVKASGMVHVLSNMNRVASYVSAAIMLCSHDYN